jgi:DNA-binding PadR family transcriptional regulator
MYPYEITTTLKERGKEDSIRLNFGSLYAVIKSLEKHGLIEIARSEREGNRPERIVYSITEAGRVEAVDWLRELIEIPAKEYPAIESGLSLIAMLPPDEVIRLLKARVEHLDDALEARKAEAEVESFSRIPELFMVEFHFKTAMLEAERVYIHQLGDRLERGELGGQAMWAGMHQLLAEGRSMHEIYSSVTAGEFGEEAAQLFSQ